MNEKILTTMAGMVPATIRKTILEERFIDMAINNDITGTPMEYLFDVYEEFLDIAGDHDNWTCHKCRGEILYNWRLLKPYLIALEK